MHTCMEPSPSPQFMIVAEMSTFGILLWPKYPWPKRPRPKCPFPKCSTFHFKWTALYLDIEHECPCIIEFIKPVEEK